MPLYRQHSKLVLASASPRRRELLGACGIRFEAVASNCEEVNHSGESPQDMVKRLALLKASTVAESFPDKWVLGADTDVILDGRVLGKPASKLDAEQLLETIQGRSHLVWGGFALLNKTLALTHVEVHVSRVTMTTMDRATIRAYVETGEPLDKAGAYAVQGIGAMLVQSIEGSYTNVVGLNLEALMLALLKYNILSLTE